MSVVPRPGVTVIELMVVLALVGLIASVTVLALRRPARVADDDPGRVITDIRRRALREGIPQSARLHIDSAQHEVVALPDGSIVTDTGVAIERFTARWTNAR